MKLSADRGNCLQGNKEEFQVHSCLSEKCVPRSTQQSHLPTSFGFQTLSLQMVTSVKAALACIRATVKTALGNTRAPVWKAMKAKTVNYVSFSSRYAFMPELPEESKLGTRGKQLKHARKQFHVTSDLEPVLRYDGPLQ